MGRRGLVGRGEEDWLVGMNKIGKVGRKGLVRWDGEDWLVRMDNLDFVTLK